jgi:hypothetical protein
MRSDVACLVGLLVAGGGTLGCKARPPAIADGGRAPAARQPLVLDLLRDRQSWRGHGWRFGDGADGGAPRDGSAGATLTVHYCCTGSGLLERTLPVSRGRYLVRVHHTNSECPKAAHVDIWVSDGPADAGNPRERTHLAFGDLDALAAPRDATFSFAVDEQTRAPVVLTLYASGGLHCCGDTVVDAITLSEETADAR